MDISLSGTRKEELLLDPEELGKITILRKQLCDFKPIEAMEMLHKLFAKFPTNKELLNNIG
jgi:transcription termination factor Rho